MFDIVVRHISDRCGATSCRVQKWVSFVKLSIYCAHGVTARRWPVLLSVALYQNDSCMHWFQVNPKTLIYTLLLTNLVSEGYNQIGLLLLDMYFNTVIVHNLSYSTSVDNHISVDHNTPVL